MGEEIVQILTEGNIGLLKLDEDGVVERIYSQSGDEETSDIAEGMSVSVIFGERCEKDVKEAIKSNKLHRSTPKFFPPKISRNGSQRSSSPLLKGEMGGDDGEGCDC